MTGGEKRRGGRRGGMRRGGRGGGSWERTEAQTWLLEPFLLMLPGLHWTLLASTGSAQRGMTSKSLKVDRGDRRKAVIQPVNRTTRSTLTLIISAGFNCVLSAWTGNGLRKSSHSSGWHSAKPISATKRQHSSFLGELNRTWLQSALRWIKNRSNEITSKKSNKEGSSKATLKQESVEILQMMTGL